MSTTNEYFEDADDADEWNKKMKKMCKCGHTMLMHGSTMNYDPYTKQTYLCVSQCVCFDCGCKGFRPA